MEKINAIDRDTVVIWGDCTDKGLVAGGSIDLVVTSPPYNLGIEYDKHGDEMSVVDYEEFSRKWLSNCYYWLRDRGRICVNVPIFTYKGLRYPIGCRLVDMMEDIGFEFNSIILWGKTGNKRANIQTPNCPILGGSAEVIIVMSKGEWNLGRPGEEHDICDGEGFEWSDAYWVFQGTTEGSKLNHPAMFPLELPMRCIKLFSYPGAVVLDPFSGMGSTVLASRIVGRRRQLGIELSEDYVKDSLVRIRRESL